MDNKQERDRTRVPPNPQSGCQSGEDSFGMAEGELPNGCILTNGCNNSDAITREHNMSRIVWCGSFSKSK